MTNEHKNTATGHTTDGIHAQFAIDDSGHVRSLNENALGDELFRLDDQVCAMFRDMSLDERKAAATAMLIKLTEPRTCYQLCPNTLFSMSKAKASQ